MDLKQKVSEALKAAFEPDVIELDEDRGISGFVVSSKFRRISSLDRQKMITRALKADPTKLTSKELRRILIIAALTPAEYEFAVSDGGSLSGRWD